eukprot:935022-Pleurochrysis_carterae.AAC.1
MEGVFKVHTGTCFAVACGGCAAIQIGKYTHSRSSHELSIEELVKYDGNIVRAKAGLPGTEVPDPPASGDATVLALLLGRDAGCETR